MIEWGEGAGGSGAGSHTCLGVPVAQSEGTWDEFRHRWKVVGYISAVFSVSIPRAKVPVVQMFVYH